MPDKKEKNIRNRAQALGSFLIDDGEYKPVILATVMVAFGAAIGVNNIVDNNYDVLADATGSIQQEELMVYHTNSLSELKQQKIDLKKALAGLTIDKEFNTVTPEQEKNLIDLKANFIAAKEQTLMDLQLKGATTEGAGISEQNFDKLYNEALSFLDVYEGKIVGTEYMARIETGMLDEYLAEVGTPYDLKQASLEINKSMSDLTQEKDIASTFGATAAGLGAGGITLLTLMFGGSYLSEKSPKRTPFKRRKPHLPSNH